MALPNRLLVLDLELGTPWGAWWYAQLQAALKPRFPDIRLGLGRQPTADDLADTQVLLVGPGAFTHYLPTLKDHPHLAYYHTEPLTSWDNVGRPTAVVAPSQALAEDIGQLLQMPVRVIPAGSPIASGFHRHDLLRREPGPEELRPLLWPGLPAVDRLYGLLASNLKRTELASVFAVFAQLLDQPDWRLVVFEHEQAPLPLDQLLAANGLEDRVVRSPPVRHPQEVANALDVLLCLPWNGAGLAIELAMGCGCLPAVIDDLRWAERVDRARGIELPHFQVPDETSLSLLLDPSGSAQILRQVTRPELQARRANCRAWATSPEASAQSIAQLWNKFFA